MTRPVRILLALVALFAVAVVAIDRLAPTPGGPEGSSYATAAEGAAAYAELLRRDGRAVRRVREPLAEAAPDPGSTLVVLDPERMERDEARAIGRFVRAGGRLVAGGALVRWLGAVLPEAPAWAPAAPGRATVVAPVPETAGVGSVAFDEGGRWADLGGALPVLATPGGPVAAVARSGRGRVVLLADAEPLLNRGLPRADDAAFALAVAGEPGGRSRSSRPCTATGRRPGWRRCRPARCGSSPGSRSRRSRSSGACRGGSGRRRTRRARSRRRGARTSRRSGTRSSRPATAAAWRRRRRAPPGGGWRRAPGSRPAPASRRCARPRRGSA